MSPDDGPAARLAWERLEAIVGEAVELEGEDRGAYLEAACGGDAELRSEVESLIVAHEADPGFMETGPLSGLGAAEEPVELRERIGPFRVLERLGRGGMGEVFLVERSATDFSQRAALKVMLRGLDSDELQARFRTERQILASLVHPNIARLLDVGSTPDGQPWFLMEYVEGVPLLEYCDRAGLGVRERIALFRDVCAAVDHAHRSLVVHRDLKPGNILVTADGAPKLLDFGIAKLLAGSETLGGAAPRTRVDARALTPEYASPEQIRGDPITTACDVFVLGILLYELLTGAHPFEPEGSSLPDLQRRVTGSRPRAPSTAVEGEAAQLRGISSGELRRTLRGDLDVIVLRALQADPAARYPSVLALSDDLERYQRGLPIRARPPSLAYRLGRFTRRHPLGVPAAAVAAGLLAASMAVILRQSHRVEAQSIEVARERDEATAVRGFLLEMFGTTGPDQATGDTVTARQLLDRRRATLATTRDMDPDLKTEFLSVLAEGYEKLGLFSEAEPLAREVLASRREDPDAATSDRVDALNLLGWIRHERRDLDEAESLLEEAVALARTSAGEGGDARLARALNDLGVVMEARRELERADTLYEESLAIRRRGGEQTVGVGVTMSNLSVVRYRRGDLDAAMAMADSALAMFRTVLGPDHPRSMIVQTNLAAMRTAAGDHAGAAEEHRDLLERRRRLLGDGHLQVATSMTMLANALWAGQERIDEAEALLLDALERYRASPDATADAVATVLHLLGDIELTDGRHASALGRYRQAAEALRGVYGDAHQRRLTIASRIAVAHERMGDPRGALDAHADAERIATALWGAEDRRALAVRMDALEFLVRVGRRPLALARIEELSGPVGESGDAALARRLEAARSSVSDRPR